MRWMDEVVGRMGVTTVRMNLEEMMSMQCHFGGRGAVMLKSVVGGGGWRWFCGVLPPLWYVLLFLPGGHKSREMCG